MSALAERIARLVADAIAGEEIMVNTAHGVFTLPLQPSGLSSGPRFVVHVPAPEIEYHAAVDEDLRKELVKAAKCARKAERSIERAKALIAGQQGGRDDG